MKGVFSVADVVRLETSSAEAILRTVIALSNTNGGTIQLSSGAELWRPLASLFADCRPPLENVEIISHAGNLHLTVVPAETLVALPDGRVLGRFNAENRQLDRTEIKQLAQERSVGSFDTQSTPDGRNIADLLCRAEAPQRWLPGAHIVLEQQLTNRDSHTEHINGNLPQQLQRTVEILEALAHPVGVGAVRELLVNALAHRSYHHRAPIQVLVDSHRINIYSPGLPPGFARVSTLMHQHFHRNPRIVAHLVATGLMQGQGNGLHRLQRNPQHRLQLATTTNKHVHISIESIAETTDSLLNWRQQRVLEHIAQHGSLTERMLAVLFEHTNLHILQQDLLKLVESGRLVQINSSTGRLYLNAP